MSDSRFPSADGTWPSASQYGTNEPPAPGQPYQTGPYQPAAYEPAPYQPAAYEPAPDQTAPDGQASYPPPYPAAAYAAAPYPSAPYPSAPYAATPYPTTPWQAPPPKRRRTGLVIGLIVAVVVLCGGGVAAVALHVQTGGTATPAATVNVVKIPLGDGTALKSHLAAPSFHAKIYPVAGSTNGVETLDQFMALHFSASSDERGILQQRGFEVAAENNWTGQDGVEVSTQLLQFSDPTGAQGQMLGQHSAILDDSSYTANYKLAGIVGYGFEDPTLDKYGNRRTELIAAYGPIYIAMFIFTPGQFNRTAERADFQRQIAALTAPTA